MKKTISYFLVALVAGFSGMWAGCSTDFDHGQGGVFVCQSDNDCTGPRYVCDTAQGYCVLLTDITDPNQPNTNTNNSNGQPEVCDPDELGEDYPLDPPLDIPEQCDGQDTTCDGNIDVFFCESSSDCRDVGAEDPNGFSFTAQCNSDTGLCEFYAPFSLNCPDPFECTDGQWPEIPEDCRPN